MSCTTWQEVSAWPTQQRLALATRILHSLEHEAELAEVLPERTSALRSLIGVWKTDNPPLDEDVERIVDQERMKKYH